MSIDSSTAERPSTTTPSTGSRSPGRTTTTSPTAQRGDVAIDLAAVVEPHPCDRRLQGDEPAQRPRGLVLGAGFERPAHQHERDDEERGFEVDVGRDAGADEQRSGQIVATVE